MKYKINITCIIELGGAFFMRNKKCCSGKPGQYFNNFDKILGKYEGKESELIPILQDIQEAYGYLPQDILEALCDRTGLHPTQVMGVITFYSQFRLSPTGENIIKLCFGTACHVKGSEKIAEALKEELNIKNILTTNDVEQFNDFYLTLNFRNAGIALKQDVQKVKQHLESLTEDEMNKLVTAYDKNTIKIAPYGSLDSDLFIKNSKPKHDFVVGSLNDLSVVLDITLSEELINEGILREIIRNAQILRKDANYNIEDRVLLTITTKDEKFNKLLKNNADKVKEELLASQFNEPFTPDITKTVNINDVDITLELKRM